MRSFDRGFTCADGWDIRYVWPDRSVIFKVVGLLWIMKGEWRKRALWEHLPKKMMYQTFQVVFDYLIESGKIATDAEGKICWIWNPELVKRYVNDETLTVR